MFKFIHGNAFFGGGGGGGKMLHGPSGTKQGIDKFF